MSARIPGGWRPSIAAGLAQSGPGGIPALLPAPRATLSAYRRLVTVDIGSDGVAPSVTFAGGIALAYCGPSGTAESWALDQVYLATSVGQLDVAQVTVYAGPYMSQANLVQQYAVASNLAGGGSQIGLGGLGIATGWYILAYWTGGTNGATASLRVTGTKTALAGG